MGSWDEAAIADLLLADPVDLSLLRQISRQRGGFRSNAMRAKAWAKLLQVNRYTSPYPHEVVKAHDPHKDADQILCDIDRSLWHFAEVANWSDDKLARRRAQLTAVIHAVLLSNKSLHYYQGYHDVVAVFVLVCDNLQQAMAVTEYVSQYYMADAMGPDFKLVAQQVNLIPQLLQAIDPELFNFFVEARVDPFFCLSWVITWFAHNVHDLQTVCRLYDVFLCSHPLFVFYLSVQVIVHFRDQVLTGPCEDTVIFTLFNKLPQDLPWEELIGATDEMCEAFPPHTIHAKFELAAELQRTHNPALFNVPPHLDVDSTQPDWLLLETYKLQTGKSGCTRAMRRKRARAVQARNRLDLAMESGKYSQSSSASNSAPQRQKKPWQLQQQKQQQTAASLYLRPASAVALSVAAALVAYLTAQSAIRT